MYADNTLTPKETVRFCALGLLAGSACTYGDLAMAVRHFIDRVQGPSLDVLGTSIELLKYEGLVVANDSSNTDAMLSITDEGRSELRTLLTANIRANDSDHNKLIEALKFRYLHLLDASEQLNQRDLLLERTETQLARLADWLDREMTELESRISWLDKFLRDAE